MRLRDFNDDVVHIARSPLIRQTDDIRGNVYVGPFCGQQSPLWYISVSNDTTVTCLACMALYEHK